MYSRVVPSTSMSKRPLAGGDEPHPEVGREESLESPPSSVPSPVVEVLVVSSDDVPVVAPPLVEVEVEFELELVLELALVLETPVVVPPLVLVPLSSEELGSPVSSASSSSSSLVDPSSASPPPSPLGGAPVTHAVRHAVRTAQPGRALVLGQSERIVRRAIALQLDHVPSFRVPKVR